MVKHLALAACLAIQAAATDVFTMYCNDDNTLSLHVPYDKRAQILTLNYGDCDINSDGVRIMDQNMTDYSLEAVLDVTDCNMDSKLRSITYNQTGDLTIGRDSNGTHLTFSEYTLDAFCTYTDEYTITFDYGSLAASTADFTASGGNIGVEFDVKSYNDDFSNQTTSSTKGGEMIHLGLFVISEGFNHDAKLFAPKNCTVTDTDNDMSYTLFDTTTGSCDNSDIELSVSYNDSTDMWEIEHILFLLGSYTSSTFQLSCTVKVCDAKAPEDCQSIIDMCA
jgi:hypothetical protein